jgi:beta-glucosidase
VADALTGTVSPGGRLPVNYPRHSGQIPTFYAHKISGGRSHWKGEYVDMSNAPLYPFGHGLSYSTFDIVVEEEARGALGPDDSVTVVVRVSNTGPVRADEVVQLYSRDPVASITRPVLELQAFARVTVEPGASTTITCTVPVAALGFSGPDLAYVVEPGAVEFFVGRSSADLLPAGTVTVVGDELVATTRIAGRAVVSGN